MTPHDKSKFQEIFVIQFWNNYSHDWNHYFTGCMQMLKFPNYCVSFSFAATLRHITITLLLILYNKNNTNNYVSAAKNFTEPKVCFPSKQCISLASKNQTIVSHRFPWLLEMEPKFIMFLLLIEILGLAGSRRYLFLNARLYKIAVANWQSSYILQFYSMKTGTVTPSFIL